MRVNRSSLTKLSENPDQTAGNKDQLPAPAAGQIQHNGCGQQKDYVHRQNVEQGRAVNEQERASHGMVGMRQVEVEKAFQARTPGVNCHCGDHCEGNAKKSEVITVELKRTLPKALDNRGKARFNRYATKNTTRQECGKKDEAFGLGDESELLVCDDLEMGRKMRQSHQQQHEPTERVQLWQALQTRSFQPCCSWQRVVRLRCQ